MATDLTTTPRSRRALLTAAVGAAAVAAAASVSRVVPTRAADGDMAVMGQHNESESTTTFHSENSGALSGTSVNSRGVNGKSEAGQGVHGQSTLSAGVSGVSDEGNGVHGTSRDNRGVWGESTHGPGVDGHGATGVRASSPDGLALHTTSGRLRLDGISGIAVIQGGDTSVTVKPAVPVVDHTLVLLTSQVDLGNKTLWYTKDVNNDEFTIHISGTRSNNAQIAFLMLEQAPSQ